MSNTGATARSTILNLRKAYSVRGDMKGFSYMVQLPIKIRHTVERYLQALNRHRISIKEAMLFGSYAKGNETEWSDIDIALVSEIFDGDRIADKDKIRKITLSISSEIEVVPFAPSDFNEQNPLAKEILRTGIKLV
jgi:predicted nucleotidyltransferase